MKTFEVVLTKSYVVRIQAEDELKAKTYAEFYTSDIQDISSSDDKRIHNFKIEDIDCKMNESFEVNEVQELN